MVQDLVPTSLQASIRQQATAKVRTRLLAGMAGSVVLASVLVFLAVREPEAGIVGDAVTTATGNTAASRPAAPAPAKAAPAPVAADVQQASACDQAKAQVLAAGTDEEFDRAERRMRLLCGE